MTKDEELQAFYHKQYKDLLEQQEELSWDVDYLNFLHSIQYNNPQILQEALKIPKRVRIRRTIKKDKSGVIIFGKKGDEYTFKLGISNDEIISLTECAALELFEADISENADEISAQFEKKYKNVKQNLFLKKTQLVYSKGKAEAVEKINVLKNLFSQYKPYFDDLLYVTEKLDALPDFYLKKLRAISEKTVETDIADFIKYCPHSYLTNIMEKANKVDEGEEILILSEELI